MGRGNGGRTGKRYRAWRQAILDSATHCAYCGQPVDKTLSGRDPLGPTADHTTPLAAGGTMYGQGHLMHRQCNERKGTNPPTSAPATIPAGRTSRQW